MPGLSVRPPAAPMQRADDIMERSRPRSTLALAAAAVAAVLVAPAVPAAAAGTTVVVNSTGDAADANPGDGVCATGGLNAVGAPACTLRAAIQEANNGASPVGTVHFGLPAADPGHAGGVWTIRPASLLPALARPVTIDGYSQAGAAVNTSPTGANAVLPVTLDGVNAGSGYGFALAAGSGGSAIRGLMITGFATGGIQVKSSGNWIAGNRIQASAFDGVFVETDGNTVGGPGLADRNVISGNAGVGVYLYGSGNQTNTVSANLITGNGHGVKLHGASGNVIGGDSAAEANLIAANSGSGVWFRSLAASANTVSGNVIEGNQRGVFVDDAAHGNVIGGTAAGTGNRIAGNTEQGVLVWGSAGVAPLNNTILGNTITGNGALGIDLAAPAGADGVTPNDPGDADAGANDLLNVPVLTSAVTTGGPGTVAVAVDGTLDTPAGSYRVELFANPSGVDPGGYGEGEALVGVTTVIATGAGPTPFSTTAAATAADVLTATATWLPQRGGSGPTSELSAARAVVAPPAPAADAAIMNEDGTLTLAVLANDADPDGDPLTLASAGGAAHGTVTANADGTVTYRPAVNWSGTDGFTYTVSDGTLTAGTTVAVTVKAVDDAPRAVDDSAATTVGAPVAVDVLANDTDTEGDALKVASVRAPDEGTAAVDPAGTVTYTPPAGWSGQASFTYTVSDGSRTDTATVTVTVGIGAVGPPSDDYTPPGFPIEAIEGAGSGSGAAVPGGATTATIATGPGIMATNAGALDGAGVDAPASGPAPVWDPPDDVGDAVHLTAVALSRTVRDPRYPVLAISLAAVFVLVEHLRERRDPKLMRAARYTTEPALVFADPIVTEVRP